MYVASHFFPQIHLEQKGLERDFDCTDKVFFGADKVVVLVLAMLATLTFLSLHGVNLGPINAINSWGAAAGYGLAGAALILFFVNITLLIVRHTAVNRRQEEQLANVEEEKLALEDELQDVKNQLAELMENQASAQKSALQKRTEKLNKEIQAAHQDIDELNQMLESKATELKQIKAEHAKEKKELNQALKEKETELKQTQEVLEKKVHDIFEIALGEAEKQILEKLQSMLPQLAELEATKNRLEEGLKNAEETDNEEEVAKTPEETDDEEVNPDFSAKQTQKRVQDAMTFSRNGKDYPMADLGFKCLSGEENAVRARAAFFRISQAELPCDSEIKLVELSGKINEGAHDFSQLSNEAEKKIALDELEKNTSLMKRHLEEILNTTCPIPGGSIESAFETKEFF